MSLKKLNFDAPSVKKSGGFFSSAVTKLKSTFNKIGQGGSAGNIAKTQLTADITTVRKTSSDVIDTTIKTGGDTSPQLGKDLIDLDIIVTRPRSTVDAGFDIRKINENAGTKTANNAIQDVINNSSNSVREKLKKVFNTDIEPSTSLQGKMDSLQKKYDSAIKGGEFDINSPEVKSFLKEVDIESKKIDANNPLNAEILESKMGKGDYSMMKKIALVGSLGGLGWLLLNLLAKEYSGCFLHVTTEDETKLNCNPEFTLENLEACSCGDAPRDLNSTATAEFCRANPGSSFPYCSCSGTANVLKTCSIDPSVKGGISYSYKDYSPISAAAQLITNVGSDILNELAGAFDIKKYIMYFVYVILGIVGAVIIFTLLKFLIPFILTKKNNK
jgi:hypothetical protein